MKAKLLVTSLRTLATATMLFAAGVLHAANLGQPAPAFTLTDLDGKTHSLADFKGKTVVLEWTSSKCPFVVKHYEKSGNLPATQKAATADGVVWLLISSGAAGKQGDRETSAAKAWLASVKAAATAYLLDSDGKVGKAYGAKVTPHLFVINAEGVLVYRGAIDSIRSADAADIPKAENYVNSALAALKAGKPIENADTKPYGCGVKY